MALPAGITTATVTAGVAQTFSGAFTRQHITITPSASLIHTATGIPLVNFMEEIASTEGVAGQFVLPHTDQDGFQDEAGNAYKNWYYTATIQYQTDRATLPAKTKTFQLTSGQTVVDLDLLPTGVPAMPYTAPVAVVTSVNGQTGSVLVEGATDSAVAEQVTSGPETVAALSATILDKVQGEKDQPGASLYASLPRFMGLVAGYNDVTAPTLRIISNASSVGQGPNGGVDNINNISGYFTTKLNQAINRLGNLNIVAHNGSVSGSIITEGYTGDYVAAKTAAGGTPAILLLGYGMNDGMPSQYHAGQTYTAVYTRTKQLIEMARADGGDVVVFTSPHPHTTRTSWNYTGTPTYPSGTITPTGDYAGSVKQIPAPSGVGTVPASYRHLRVNDSFRRAAAELGAVLIDAERYWFDAVQEYGEDALFNTGQFNHPNLFGYQQSYHKAIDAFAKSLVRPVVNAGAAVLPTQVVKRKLTNATTTSATRITDSELSFSAGANTVWEVDVDLFYNSPTANDLRVSWEFPAGATGFVAGLGPSITTTAVNGGEVVGRSSSTMTTSIAFGGNTSGAYARARAVVRVGATAGTIGLQFGVDVEGGTATLYADTIMRARQI